MSDKNSIMWAGEMNLIFTDEAGEPFVINCPKISTAKTERLLFSKEIRRFCGDRAITAEKREKIISKVLELTPEINWIIK